MKKMIESIFSKINPQYLIIIGSVISVFGAYIASIKTDKGSQKTNVSIEENKTLTIKNMELTSRTNLLSQANEELLKQNLEYAKLQKNLSEINIELTNEIKEKSYQIDDYNKGIGGYCTMEVLENSDDPGRVLFITEGKNPLKDLAVRIFDLNLWESTNNFNDSNTNISLGNLYLNQSLFTNYRVKLDKDKGVRLNLFYSSNNGFFTETVRMFYVNNKLERENIVYNGLSNDGKPLLLKRSANFPLKESALNKGK